MHILRSLNDKQTNVSTITQKSASAIKTHSVKLIAYINLIAHKINGPRLKSRAPAPFILYYIFHIEIYLYLIENGDGRAQFSFLLSAVI